MFTFLGVQLLRMRCSNFEHGQEEHARGLAFTFRSVAPSVFACALLLGSSQWLKVEFIFLCYDFVHPRKSLSHRVRQVRRISVRVSSFRVSRLAHRFSHVVQPILERNTSNSRLGCKPKQFQTSIGWRYSQQHCHVVFPIGTPD